jgi:hypothetical protein
VPRAHVLAPRRPRRSWHSSAAKLRMDDQRLQLRKRRKSRRKTRCVARFRSARWSRRRRYGPRSTPGSAMIASETVFRGSGEGSRPRPEPAHRGRRKREPPEVVDQSDSGAPSIRGHYRRARNQTVLGVGASRSWLNASGPCPLPWHRAARAPCSGGGEASTSPRAWGSTDHPPLPEASQRSSWSYGQRNAQRSTEDLGRRGPSSGDAWRRRRISALVSSPSAVVSTRVRTYAPDKAGGFSLHFRRVP